MKKPMHWVFAIKLKGELMGKDIMDIETIEKTRALIKDFLNCGETRNCYGCKCKERLPNSKATVCTLLSLFKEQLIVRFSDTLGKI